MLECLEPFARKKNPEPYGLIRITAPEAREITRRHGFAHQRLPDRRHVGALAEMMVHGEWREMSLLTFVWTPAHETLLLVDAQHRLLAQGQLDDDSPPMEWLVRLLVEKDPRLTYAYLDSYQKRRPPGVEGRALRFERLSEQALTTCVAAAETVLLYDQEHEVHARMCGRVSLPDKIAYVDHHLRSFQQVDALLQLVENRELRRRLYGGRLQAVLLATVDHYADNAIGFWRRFLRTLVETSWLSPCGGCSFSARWGPGSEAPRSTGPEYAPCGNRRLPRGIDELGNFISIKVLTAPSGPMRLAIDQLIAPKPRQAPDSFKTRVLVSAWNHYYANDHRERRVRVRSALPLRGTTILIPEGR